MEVEPVVALVEELVAVPLVMTTEIVSTMILLQTLMVTLVQCTMMPPLEIVVLTILIHSLPLIYAALVKDWHKEKAVLEVVLVAALEVDLDQVKPLVPEELLDLAKLKTLAKLRTLVMLLLTKVLLVVLSLMLTVSTMTLLETLTTIPALNTMMPPLKNVATTILIHSLPPIYAALAKD